MTIEEKLDKATEFIKSIESMNVKYLTNNGALSMLEDLKDKAWHILADFV